MKTYVIEFLDSTEMDYGVLPRIYLSKARAEEDLALLYSVKEDILNDGLKFSIQAYPVIGEKEEMLPLQWPTTPNPNYVPFDPCAGTGGISISNSMKDSINRGDLDSVIKERYGWTPSNSGVLTPEGKERMKALFNQREEDE